MSNPCDTCAFKPGTVTHDEEPWNHLQGLIALLGPMPFYCHYLADGKDHHADKSIPRHNMSGAMFRQLGFRVCAGWKQAVKELAAAGYFKDSPKMTKVYALIARDELEIFLATEDGSEDKEEARERLQKCMARLGEKRRKYD